MQQTEWQIASGRDKVSLWNVLNAYLTSEVEIFARHYLNKQACDQFESLQQIRCLAWRPYFKAHRLKKPLLSRRSMQRLMWKAHTVTIKTVLSEHEFVRNKDFNNSEFLFWRGWVRMVFKLEKLNYPTIGFFVSPIVSRYMPSCSNLDTKGCQTRNFAFDQRLFIKGIKNGKLDLVMDIINMEIFE